MTTVLGIESSCDETAAALVRDGREILSSVVVSQAAEHAEFGGVVPEVAGRSHLREILPVVDRALADADLDLDDVDVVAVTSRPGLIGSLLVGLSTAKALAFTRDLPLVAVDHLEAHAWAAVMEADFDPYPCTALIVSGGHTSLYRADSPLQLARLATTLDDAAGEAFDKVAWLLGLEYPGGPSVSRLADEGDPAAVAFPRYVPRGPDAEPAFSFSGLKTAVLYHLRGGDALAPTPPPTEIRDRAGIAASFQEAVVDQLVDRTIRTTRSAGLDTALVVGGVACNRRLREKLTSEAERAGLRAVFPSPAYCTDNAAMIAGLGHERWRAGKLASWNLDASPR